MSARVHACFGYSEYIFEHGKYETTEERAVRIIARELGRACRCARRDDYTGAGEAFRLAELQLGGYWPSTDERKRASDLIQAVREALHVSIIDADGKWQEYMEHCERIAREQAR